MTTIKAYCNQNAENYLEIMNADNDTKEVAIDISLEDIKNIYTFYLSKDDASELIRYLKEQFEL